MNKLIWAPALCLALGAAGVVGAAPRVDADPGRDYAVSPDAGPWMICAAYFNGPSAPDLARQMALQIRGRYNAPAWVFNYAEEERKKAQELIDQQRQALPFDAPPDGSENVVPVPRRHTVVNVEEQCAVLIGGYPDEDTAHKALLVVKKWPKPQLKVREGEPDFAWVAYDHGKEIEMNPFEKMSMVVRNPSMPHDSTAPDKSKDKFLLTLNADEEYSMLRCPGTYTLAVKEYLGASMVKPEQSESSGLMKMIGLGNRHEGESLALAANNAHELARTLRHQGAEAYVLHTRTSSVVSIGSFSGPNDPRMKDVCTQYAMWQQQVARAQKDPSKPDPLGLFPAPVLIEVPHPDR